MPYNGIRTEVLLALFLGALKQLDGPPCCPHPTSDNGTKLSNRNVRLPVANGGKADIQPALPDNRAGRVSCSVIDRAYPTPLEPVRQREPAALGRSLGPNNPFALTRRKSIGPGGSEPGAARWREQFSY